MNRRAELIRKGCEIVREHGILQADVARWGNWTRRAVSDVFTGRSPATRGAPLEVARLLIRIATDERLPPDLERVDAPAHPQVIRPPEGHPSRYRILQHNRIPEWARRI